MSNDIMKFFKYSHLPKYLQEASKPFCDAADFINNSVPDSDERRAGLRKLLEAKDCIVRCHVGLNK